METKETMTLLNKSTGELETFNIHTGEIVAREGELIPTHTYSIETADAICNLIREGNTFKQVSKLMRIPLHLIYNWRTNYPDFKKKLSDARRDRGTYFMDKAVEVLEESDIIEKEEVPGKKFKFDSYVKLAGMDSPNEYAPKPAAVSTAAPATIIINTGINRDPIQIQGIDNEQGTILPTPLIRETQDSGEEQTRGAFREIEESGRGESKSGEGSQSREGTQTRGSGVEEGRSSEEKESKEKGKQEE